MILVILTMQISVAASNQTSKIEVLTEVAKSLGDIGDSIVKITDGIKHVVVTGEEGINYFFARKARKDLINLSAKSTQFSAYQNVAVTVTIDEYLRNPSYSGWVDVQERLLTVVKEGAKLLSEWNDERSDFIVEPSYASLIESLNSRISILEKLLFLEPPITESELNVLKNVNIEYKKLMREFRLAVNELNVYLKQYVKNYKKD
ncbi:hypothetical protein EA58_21260 [Photobacterium galatheae]|uniref:Uncharacterized protein n=2 Tax=Photobacterium galatheae TaxID=1654360 RepID=A0A066RQM2_9GAMM|nr:hypothetical protein EA58_21260 [Photobacterium galatheae]